MSPGFPGNFERVFQQYDRIVSGSKPPESQPPEPSNPGPVQNPASAGPRDDPPWLPDSVEKNPEKSFGNMQAERMAAAEQRINEHL